MIDLIYNLFGSLVAAGLGWVYLKVTPRKERRQLAESLAATIVRLYSCDIPGSEKGARAFGKDDKPPSDTRGTTEQ